MRKLSRMSQYLDELESVRPDSFEGYVEDIRTRRAVERLLQLIVEVANDINVHAVVDYGHPPPNDYYDGFLKASEIGLLPESLARSLAPAAGERNILVHEYETIDNKIVYESIQLVLTGFRQYVSAVLQYLENAKNQ